MILSIGAIIIIAVVIGFILLILFGLFRLLKPEKPDALYIGTVVLVIGVIIVLIGCLIFRLRITPPAQGISDVLDVADASGQLLIRSVRMPAPTYTGGKGTAEKTYESILTVDVMNRSDQELYLGMEYYMDAGSIGPYSPGARAGAKVIAVPANWAGELQFPLPHLRFVEGGSINLTFAKCEKAASEALFRLPDAEQLHEKKYVMVPE